MISDSAPLRFLVVDDDLDIRDLLIGMIERLGHTAHPARDGVAAIEALASREYDFMLLDLTMPRMSGEDVLRWLGDHPEWGMGLRIVVVSAKAGTPGVTARELGVHAVLPKPLRAQQLREVVGGTR